MVVPPISTPKWSVLVGKPMGLLGKPTILGSTPIPLMEEILHDELGTRDWGLWTGFMESLVFNATFHKWFHPRSQKQQKTTCFVVPNLKQFEIFIYNTCIYIYRWKLLYHICLYTYTTYFDGFSLAMLAKKHFALSSKVMKHLCG